jgi:hypothetical protein
VKIDTYHHDVDIATAYEAPINPCLGFQALGRGNNPLPSSESPDWFCQLQHENKARLSIFDLIIRATSSSSVIS